MSGCALFPVAPDEDAVSQIDPATAKAILQANCSACEETSVWLTCDDDYFINGKEINIEYPYHDLAMICYVGYIEIMGRQTDCVSKWNREKLPRLELQAKDSDGLCNAAFAVINNAREQKGIGAWQYYKQKAEPEK